MRPSLIIMAALSVAGFLLSQELVVVHADSVHAGAADSGICGASEGFSCKDVALSKYSSIAGLPIASLGEAFYLVVFGLALLGRLAGDRLRGIPDALVGVGFAAVGYSVFLGVVSAVVVGKLCPLCLGLYGSNGALLVTALVGHPQRAGLLGRLVRLPATAVFWVAVGLMGVGTFGARMEYGLRVKDAQSRSPKHAHGHAQDAPVKRDVDLTGMVARGRPDAPVVVVEFSDFECPFCGRLADALKVVQDRNPDLFRYYFRQYPMDNACNRTVDGPFHERACAAAVATICAQRQGRFWELHDAIFADSKALSPADLESKAARVGLDVDAFRDCLADPSALAQVKADVEEGIKLGVQGTPTFFVNGWQQVGARDPARLEALLKQAQQQALREGK